MPSCPMSMPGISWARTGEDDNNRHIITFFTAANSTRRLAEQVHQFGKFDPRLLWITAFDGIGHAMIGMGLQQFILDLAQRGLDGLDLRQDVDAIAIFLDHAGDTADLALDAGKALD